MDVKRGQGWESDVLSEEGGREVGRAGGGRTVSGARVVSCGQGRREEGRDMDGHEAVVELRRCHAVTHSAEQNNMTQGVNI